MDWNSPAFWAAFLHAVAYREGEGDHLAEGGWRAARALDLGQDRTLHYYPGWGYSSHHDGRNQWDIHFPYWLPVALQWLADTRNPIGSGHASLWGRGIARPVWQTEDTVERRARLDEVRAFGERVYGHPAAIDPYSGYTGKARVGYYHTLRSVIKDCVSVDDLCFPLIWNRNSADGRYVFSDIEGVGDVEGTSVEYHLFRAGTGVEWSEGEFERAVKRVHALERAVQVRHWGRDRTTDEMVLPYFEQVETCPSPVLGERVGLDRAKFRPVVDEFYALHGWDRETGWPTKEALGKVGLADVYKPMAQGASQATAED
jgi:aldehyde:ferredoxin oxidoreductase